MSSTNAKKDQAWTGSRSRKQVSFVATPVGGGAKEKTKDQKNNNNTNSRSVLAATNVEQTKPDLTAGSKRPFTSAVAGPAANRKRAIRGGGTVASAGVGRPKSTIVRQKPAVFIGDESDETKDTVRLISAKKLGDSAFQDPDDEIEMEYLAEDDDGKDTSGNYSKDLENLDGRIDTTEADKSDGQETTFEAGTVDGEVVESERTGGGFGG